MSEKEENSKEVDVPKQTAVGVESEKKEEMPPKSVTRKGPNISSDKKFTITLWVSIIIGFAAVGTPLWMTAVCELLNNKSETEKNRLENECKTEKNKLENAIIKKDDRIIELERRAVSTEKSDEKRIDLVYPLDRAELVRSSGKIFDFQWQPLPYYWSDHVDAFELVKVDGMFQTRDDEIKDFNPALYEPRLYSIPHKANNTFDFNGSISQGLYLWRVGSTKQNIWSEYRMLRVFDSVVDRIAISKTLRVGVPLIFRAVFNSKNSSDRELKIVEAIAEKLREKLGRKDLKIEYISNEWPELLKTVNEGDVDFGIGYISRTEEREQDYKFIKFTKPYTYNEQAVIVRKDANQSLKLRSHIISGKKKNGKNKVCVLCDSTNRLAAQHLVNSLHWEIFPSNDQCGSPPLETADILIALMQNKCNIAIIDKVRYCERYMEIAKIGLKYVAKWSNTINEDLGEFRKKRFGVTNKDKKDELVIAVHSPVHPDPSGQSNEDIYSLIDNKIRPICEKCCSHSPLLTVSTDPSEEDLCLAINNEICPICDKLDDLSPRHFVEDLLSIIDKEIYSFCNGGKECDPCNDEKYREYEAATQKTE